MINRTEQDSMGKIEIPSEALYGAQTRLAELNFPISGWHLPDTFIHALGLVKYACARVNRDLDKLDESLSTLIEKASLEISEGKFDDQFIIDVFQTGSGTSTNMNANEIIANRAIQLSGGVIGSKSPVHPNDHVNMGQSSNDVIPTAMHVAASLAIRNDLRPALAKLRTSLDVKAQEFDYVVKIGRTHLMDATPIRMGQVFSGYSEQVGKGISRIDNCMKHLGELPIGGTAVGTGVNTHREFGSRVSQVLSEISGIEFVEASNHFEAQSSKDAIVETAAMLKTVAISIQKIANDIRFLGSGPRCGIGELILPETQPGSSIMPGKVNPVIPESVIQVCAYVVGADAGISHAASTLSNFELSIAMPFMAYQLLESIRILTSACNIFVEKCIDGLKVNSDRCSEMIEKSLAMVTSLTPIIGYDKAAEIVKEAYETGRNIREILYEKKIADKEIIDSALDPIGMTHPSTD